MLEDEEFELTLSDVTAAIAANKAGQGASLLRLLRWARWGLHHHGRIRIRRFQVSGTNYTHLLVDGRTLVRWGRYTWPEVATEAEMEAEAKQKCAERSARREAQWAYNDLRDRVSDAIRTGATVWWREGQEGGTLALSPEPDAPRVSANGAARLADVPTLERVEYAIGDMSLCSTKPVRWACGRWSMTTGDEMDFDPVPERLSGRIDRREA